MWDPGLDTITKRGHYRKVGEIQISYIVYSIVTMLIS